MNQNTPWITEMDTQNSQIGKDMYVYVYFPNDQIFGGVPLTLIVGRLDKLPLTIFVPLTLGFHQGNVNHHHSSLKNIKSLVASEGFTYSYFPP